MSGLIAVVDVETTGLDPKKDQVIEAAWAYVEVETAALVEIHSQLFEATANPAEATNGIAPGLLARRGEEPRAIDLNEVDAILAHNASFDSKWGVFRAGSAPWVCTYEDWEWPRASSGKRVVDIALAHGVGVVSAHRAYSDVLTLCLTLERAHQLVPLSEQLRQALVPRHLYAAHVRYDERELAKVAGFRWVPESKQWVRRLTEAQAEAVAFPVSRIEAQS